jgi:hypothetical protein
MGQRLSAVGMWGSCVRDSTACCSRKQVRFHNAETLCEAIIMQKRFVKKRNRNIQNLEKKKEIEYKFSVKHFPIWCYKCDTMFFVDKNKTNFIHLS